MTRPFAGLWAAALALLCLALALGQPAFAAPGVSADIAGRISGSYAGASGVGSVGFSFNKLPLLQLSPGNTTVGQADLLYAGQRTITASSSENLDLAGVLTDPLGATLTFVHVKAIYVHALVGNTNTVVVGGAASNAFVGPLGGTTPTQALGPDGWLIWVNKGAGWPVVASTGDLLKVANGGSGSSVTYEILVFGTSN